MSIAATEKYGELGAADATLALPVGGYGTIGIQLSGTWVGTVTFEATIDTGTWQSINVVKTNSTTQVTTATGNGIWFGACAGLRVVRARMSAYTSGTAQVQLLAAGTGGGSGSGGGGGGGGGTSSDFGAAFPAAGTAAGFTDGTDMQPALVDAQGHLQVDVLSGGGGSSPFGDPMPADGVPIGFQDSGGDLAPVVLEADGSIPVTVVSGGGSNASVGTIDAAAPTSATQTGFTDASSGELRAWTSENLDYDTGAGSAPQTIVGIALPSSGGPVAGGTSSNPLRVDPTGSTTQPVSGTVTADQGGAPWSVSQSGTWDIGTVTTLTSITNAVTVAQGTAANLKAEVVGAGSAGTANAGVVTVQGIAGMTKLLVTPDANSAVNVAQLAGTTTDTNSGNKSAGTLRVVLATDQPTMTNPQPVTVASKTVYQRPVYGTAQTVFDSSTDIAAGNFSSAGTNFTNNDGTIGAAPYADAMIEMPDWGAAPAAGTVVELWGTLIDVDGTDDDTDPPSGTAQNGARYFGSWIVDDVDALQRRTITISLAGVQNGFTPYIKNGTAQNMNNDAGTNMVVKITPWTIAMVG